MEPNAIGHIAGIMLALDQAGKLNASAARWTSLSVVASSLSAVFGAV
jgi:hypothetical protein